MNKEQLDTLSRLKRDDLYNCLEYANTELKEINHLYEEAKIHESRANEISQEIDLIQHRASRHLQQGTMKRIRGNDGNSGLFLFFGMIVSFFVAAKFSQTIGILIGTATVVYFLFSATKYKKKRLKELDLEKNRELDIASEYKNKAEQKIKDAKYLWLFEGYCYHLALETMMDIIAKGRANNWVEVADKYEEQSHRWTLEENSNKQLRLQIQQAELAEKTLNATRSTRNWVGIWFR
jgi:hypothetical protein